MRFFQGLRAAIVLSVLGLGLLVLGSCLSGSGNEVSPTASLSQQGAGIRHVPIAWSQASLAPAPGTLAPPAQKPWTLVEASPAPKAPDATSSATGAAEAPAAVSGATGSQLAKPAGPAAVSGASSLTEAEGAAYCLKCHGPIQKLQETTKGFISEWDEAVNPHMFVPHDSQTVADCGQCHKAHPIPYTPGSAGPKPRLQYCYSCHHTEELKSCKECHQE